MTDWETQVESLKASQDQRQATSWGERRAFLKRVGIDRHLAQKSRLREQDGLSDEAWWASVRAVMAAQKSSGHRRGKAVGKPSSTGQFPESTNAGDITVETLIEGYADDMRRKRNASSV